VIKVLQGALYEVPGIWVGFWVPSCKILLFAVIQHVARVFQHG